MASTEKTGNFGKSKYSGNVIKRKITINTRKVGKQKSAGGGGSSSKLSEAEKKRIFDEAVKKAQAQAVAVAKSGIFASKSKSSSKPQRVIRNGAILERQAGGGFVTVGYTAAEQARRDRIRSGTARAADIIPRFNPSVSQAQRGRQILQRISNVQSFEQQRARQRQKDLESQARGRAFLSREQPKLEVRKQTENDLRKISSVLGIRYQPRLSISQNLARYRSRFNTERSNLTTSDVNKLQKWADAINRRGEKLSEQEQTFISFIKNTLNNERQKTEKFIESKFPKKTQKIIKTLPKASQILNTYLGELGVGVAYTPARIAQAVEKGIFLGKLQAKSAIRNDTRRFWRSLMRENVRSSPYVQQALRDAFKDPATYIFTLITARQVTSGKKPIGVLEREPPLNSNVAKALKNEAIITKTDLKNRVKVIDFDERGQIKQVQIINTAKKKPEQIRVKQKKSNKVKYLEYNERGQLIRSGFIGEVNNPPRSAAKPKKIDKVKVYEYDERGRLVKTGFARRIAGSKDRYLTSTSKPKSSILNPDKIKVLFYNEQGKLIRSTFGKRISGTKDRFLPATSKVKVKKSKSSVRERIYEYDERGRLLRTYFADAESKSKIKPTRAKVDERIKVFEFDENGRLVKSFYGKKSKIKKDNFVVSEKGTVELTKNNLLPFFKDKKGQVSVTITRLEKTSITKTKTLRFRNRKPKYKVSFKPKVLRLLMRSPLIYRKAISINILPSKLKINELQSLANDTKLINKYIQDNIFKVTDREKLAEREIITTKPTTRTKQSTSTKQKPIQKTVQRTKQRKKPEIPKLPLPKIKFPQPPKSVENPRGYDVFIRTGAQWKRYNKKPLSKAGAGAFGRWLANNSVARSFVIVGVKNKATKLPSFVAKTSPSLFRSPKRKSKLQSQAVIEKRKYLINTLGEKKGLRAAQILRKAQRVPKRKKARSKPIKRPRKRKR